MIDNVKKLLAHTVYQKWSDSQREIVLRHLNRLWELFEWVNKVGKSITLDIPLPPNSEGLTFTNAELITLYYYMSLFGEVLGIRNWTAFDYYRAEMTEKFLDQNPTFTDCEIEVTEDGSIYVHAGTVLPFTKCVPSFVDWKYYIVEEVQND